MVGCPEEEKHDDHQKYQFNGFSFLVVLAGKQCLHDSEVTVTHNEQREQEAKDVCFHVAEHRPDVLQDLRVVPEALIFRKLCEHELGCCHQDGCCPDSEADGDAMLHCPVVHGVGGQDNGQVPIDADDGDEEYASKKTNEEEGSSEFARCIVKALFPYQIMNPERQGGYKKQIGQGQVQEINVGDTLGLLTMGECKHHQQISHQAKGKDKGVYYGQEGSSKSYNIPYMTGFRTLIILKVF